MALNILFSSMGLAFYEHTCSLLQETTVNLRQDDRCCGEALVIESDFEGHQLRQGDCCHTDIELKKLETKTNSSLKKVSHSSVHILSLGKIPTPDFTLILDDVIFQGYYWPPPCSANPLYILFDVFLI